MLLPYYGQFKRPTAAAKNYFKLLNFAPTLHFWTLNHQHGYTTIDSSPFAAIDPLLLNNKGFRSKASQNTADARTEVERPTTARQKVDTRSTFLSEFFFRRRSSFLLVRLSMYIYNHATVRNYEMNQKLKKIV